MTGTEDPLETALSESLEQSDGEEISVRDVMQIFGARSFGPVLALLGLIAVLPPLGGIPGVPTAIGLVVILTSVQIMAGRDHVWLPSFLGDRAISRDTLNKAFETAKPYLAWIDARVSQRLQWLFGRTADFVAGAVVTLLALSMPPLELLPFAVAVPGSAIAAFGLAIMARDGLLLLAAFGLSLVAGWLVIIAIT